MHKRFVSVHKVGMFFFARRKKIYLYTVLLCKTLHMKKLFLCLPLLLLDHNTWTSNRNVAAMSRWLMSEVTSAFCPSKSVGCSYLVWKVMTLIVTYMIGCQRWISETSSITHILIEWGLRRFCKGAFDFIYTTTYSDEK